MGYIQQVQHVSQQRSGAIPKLQVGAGSRTATAIVDSGAAISCMHRATYDALPPSLRSAIFFTPDQGARGADGSPLPMDGLAEAVLEVPGIGKVRHTFAVMRSLNFPIIIGMDFLTPNNASIDCVKGTVSFKPRTVPGLFFKKAQTIAPRTSFTARAHMVSHNLDLKKHVMLIESPNSFVLDGSITKHTDRTADITLVNQSDEPILVPAGKVIAVANPVPRKSLVTFEHLVPDAFVSTIKPSPPSKEKWEKIEAAVGKQEITEEQKQTLRELLLRFHDVVAKDKRDLGWTDVIPHKLELKDPACNPAFTRQHPIPDAHQQFINDTVDELLASGAIREDFTSSFNSPIFAVKKPHGGGLRLVIDMRKVNELVKDDFESFADVETCLRQLGGLQANFMSSIDLLSAYWQLALHEESQPMTAFTVPGRGKFCWTVSAMGLKTSPAAFVRLMHFVFRGLKSTVSYLDDLIVGSSTWDKHLEDLAKCFERLRAYNLKLNIDKCSFGQKEVEYLGFRISGKGIFPSQEKTKAIAEFPPPTDVKAIRRFVGLANYFRQFMPRFSHVAGKLTELIKTSNPYSKGPLPPEAMEAFLEMRRMLSSSPCIHFPNPKFHYVLETDGSLEGLGADLLQLTPEGLAPIAFASRSLQPAEKNYSAFLLEHAAAVFGVETFRHYLTGIPFTLAMDHKPLEKLSKVHTRTLLRLKELMSEFSFELVYREGEGNKVADALSRSPLPATPICNVGTESLFGDVFQLPTVSVIENEAVLQGQREDEFCQAAKAMLSGQAAKFPAGDSRFMKQILGNCRLDDRGHLVIDLRGADGQMRSALVVPKTMRFELLRAAHSSRFAGHSGADKTLLRLRQNYWWPGMANEVSDFVKTCKSCEAVKDPPKMHANKEPLRPMPIADRPNERLHADLFQPGGMSGKGNKYILVLTDAFSKWVELVAIPRKDAQVVAEAIFNQWICRRGCPRSIVTDRGREFCNELSRELWERLEVDHKKTSAYHPQTNSAAESFNRELIRLLTITLEHPDNVCWEAYLPLVALSYNTTVRRATKASPFFLTYLADPQLPSFDWTGGEKRKIYGENWACDAIRRMEVAFTIARDGMEKAAEANKKLADEQGCKSVEFKVGEFAWVKHPRAFFASIRNKKLARTWLLYEVVQRVGETTYWCRRAEGAQKGRRSLIHRNRMKKAFSCPVSVSTDPEDEENCGTDERQSQDTPQSTETKENKDEKTKPKPGSKEKRTTVDDAPLRFDCDEEGGRNLFWSLADAPPNSATPRNEADPAPGVEAAPEEWERSNQQESSTAQDTGASRKSQGQESQGRGDGSWQPTHRSRQSEHCRGAQLTASGGGATQPTPSAASCSRASDCPSTRSAGRTPHPAPPSATGGTTSPPAVTRSCPSSSCTQRESTPSASCAWAAERTCGSPRASTTRGNGSPSRGAGASRCGGSRPCATGAGRDNGCSPPQSLHLLRQAQENVRAMLRGERPSSRAQGRELSAPQGHQTAPGTDPSLRAAGRGVRGRPPGQDRPGEEQSSLRGPEYPSSSRWNWRGDLRRRLSPGRGAQPESRQRGDGPTVSRLQEAKTPSLRGEQRAHRPQGVQQPPDRRPSEGRREEQQQRQAAQPLPSTGGQRSKEDLRPCETSPTAGTASSKPTSRGPSRPERAGTSATSSSTCTTGAPGRQPRCASARSTDGTGAGAFWAGSAVDASTGTMARQTRSQTRGRLTPPGFSPPTTRPRGEPAPAGATSPSTSPPPPTTTPTSTTPRSTSTSAPPPPPPLADMGAWPGLPRPARTTTTMSSPSTTRKASNKRSLRSNTVLPSGFAPAPPAVAAERRPYGTGAASRRRA